jgi:hypothetical protein
MAAGPTRRIVLVAWLAIAGSALGFISAGAESAVAPAGPAWIQEVTLNGFLATSYSYNFNRPVSRTNQYRVFDVNVNTFALDEFELVLQKAVAKPRDTGFRVDLTLGSSVPHLTASAGLFRDENGQAGDFDAHQVFASWVAPLGSGLRIDFGKFVTHHGYEVIDGYDGWNDNASRSFLFGYAIPFAHVGVRGAYTFSSKLAGMVMLVNGWDVAVDNNNSKSVGGQLAWTPAAPLTVVLNGMYGPERTNNDSDARALVDLVASWRTTDRLTLGANTDYGEERGAVQPGQTATWSGVAGYVRAVVAGPFSVALRGEYFADPDGARTGLPQYLAEGTLTPEVRVSPRLLMRSDIRVDRSNRNAFEKESALVTSQPTILLEAIYTF